MKKQGKLITILLTTLTLSGVSFFVDSQRDLVPVEALGTLTTYFPSTINATPASDTTIRTYYDDLDALATSERQGTNLLKNLKPILAANSKYYSYANTWKVFMVTDRDWDLTPISPLTGYTYSDNPNVRLLYRNDNGTATAAHFDDTHGVYIDREHVWPQSRGFGADPATGPAGTDVHHLILADSVNNQQGHSNYAWGDEDHGITPTPIGTVDRYNNTGIRWTAIDENGGSDNIYEPQDIDKGDIARAIFYMAARYNNWAGISGAISSYEPFLAVTDSIYDSGLGTIYSTDTTPVTMGILSTLLKWHEQDPVDEYEIYRNNLIYNNFQLNRNPFIDYPEWVEAAYGTEGKYATPSSDTINGYNETNVLVTGITLSPTSLTLAEGGSTGTLIPTIAPTNASIKTLTWSTGNASIATVSGGVVTPIGIGSTTITATATDGSGVYASIPVTVHELSERVLESISVSGYATSAPFKSTYSYSGIVVTAHYDDLTTENVTSTSTIGTVNTSSLGEQIITVTYGEETTHFLVTITNEGAIFTSGDPVVGDTYQSATASGGTINSWTGVNVGSAYADGSVKLDNSGDYIYKTDVWSGSPSIDIVSLQVSAILKLNYSSGDMAPNQVTVYALNGNLSTIVGSTSLTGVFTKTQATYNFNFSSFVDSPVTISGIKLEYTNKSAGNIGVYSISATPTYAGTPSFTSAEQAIEYAEFFLSETAPYCSVLDGGNVDWTYLSDEFGYMIGDAKDYFVDDLTIDESIVSARERYMYLINKYANLETDSFMEDSLGNPYSNRNSDINISKSSNESSNLIAIILMFGIAGVGLYIFGKTRIKQY